MSVTNRVCGMSCNLKISFIYKFFSSTGKLFFSFYNFFQVFLFIIISYSPTVLMFQWIMLGCEKIFPSLQLFCYISNLFLFRVSTLLRKIQSNLCTSCLDNMFYIKVDTCWLVKKRRKEGSNRSKKLKKKIAWFFIQHIKLEDIRWHCLFLSWEFPAVVHSLLHNFEGKMTTERHHKNLFRLTEDDNDFALVLQHVCL